MKENESSLTSLVSAFGRAYHRKFDEPKIMDDTLAEKLLTQSEFIRIGENMVNGIKYFNPEIAQTYKNQPDEILKWITQVQLSPTPLARAAYCEKVIHHEILLGAKQYVILGAGLDTFCFRNLDVIDNINIFEIDHPATQAFKKERLALAGLDIPSHLHFISMDFTKELSNTILEKSNFNSNQKTVYSLLGVSYYLTKKELENLLYEMFRNVPAGSSIVMDYADEGLFTEKGKSNRVQHMVEMAATSGEPMNSSFSYTEMETLLEKAGLLIYEQLDPEMIQHQFFANRTDYLSAFETIHYLHAVKK
ncbi:class I SAM-dependent methyltransferase [Ornithinibacillus gellani]|uniref:class I SAM-dependent methyltransferase n=1 Tax=Ornithinibacillus gellani TaxID=2293253 RepID=UPI000F470F9A|nr:class I SAM-dependent methyltransferase [Ornithinibacillus gellani]TQS75044.1 class I SAM-dependent methyltransferase [Ornithinibacillus gellani]